MQRSSIVQRSSIRRHPPGPGRPNSSARLHGQSSKGCSFPTVRKVEQSVDQCVDGENRQSIVEQIIPESAPSESSFRKHLLHRKWFRTDRFHLGMSRESVHAGDELWYLARSPAAFILRPSDHDKRTCTLVGHMYVHGLFRGSVLQDLGMRLV